MASLWGGRFEKDMDELVKKYNASIFFDQRMYNEDIDGSIAHVTMLGRQGIVSEEEKEQIIAGLKEIKQEIADGKIVFNVDDEDIHMGVESRLIKKIGDVGIGIAELCRCSHHLFRFRGMCDQTNSHHKCVIPPQ